MTSPALSPLSTPAAVQAIPSHLPLNNALLCGAVGLLLFGPLVFGGVEAWSIFILEAGAALLFLLWCMMQARSGELWVTNNPLFAPMLVFEALVVLQLTLGHTSYRQDTFSEGLLYGAYGLLCFLIVQTLRKTSQVRTLTATLSAYGFSIAMFALVENMSSNGKLYWLRTLRSGGWVYGPYVNHNHYAGLMEMLVPIPLVFSLTRSARGSSRTMAALAAAVMASTIFLCGSRGGMVAFAVQMAVLAAMLMTRRKSRKLALSLSAFLVVAAALLAWLGGGPLASRMATIRSATSTELAGGFRMQINRDGLKMFAHKPVLGWGLGVFPEVYPEFRSFYTNFFINQAHDDYLQLLVEMGALGFAVMLWFVTLVYLYAAKKLRNWQQDTNGAVALAAMLAVTGILAHSFLDFNLHIPANAALFYVISVIAAMEPRFGISRRKALRRGNLLARVWGAGSGKREQPHPVAQVESRFGLR